MTGQIQPRTAAPLARPIMPMAPMVTAQPSMTPQEILSILWRHWKLIGISVITGILIFGVLYFFQNMYSARYTTIAYIQVLPQGDQDPTEIGEPTLSKDIQYQARNTVASEIKQQRWRDDLLRLTTIRNTSWYKKIDPEKGQEKWYDFSSKDPATRAQNYFKKHLTVIPDRDTNLVQLKLETYGNNAIKDGSLILDTIVQLHYDYRKDSNSKDLIARKNELTNQQKSLSDKLQVINEGMANLRSTHSLGNLTGINFRDYMEEKLADLETQSSTLESETARLKSEVIFLKTRAESDYDAVVREQIEQDPVASQMRQRLTDLDVTLSGQLASFGENHRRVRETRDARDQARKDLEDRQKQIGDIVRQSQYILFRENLDSKTAELKAREVQLETARKQHGELRNARALYEKQEIQRDETLKQLEVLNGLLDKYTGMIANPNIARIVKYTSISPLEKDWPRWYYHIIGGGLVLGLMVGLGITFLLELSNKLLRTPRDVMRHVSAPLLGMICHERDDAETEGVDLLQVVRQAPCSFMSDNYRQFRTNLRLSESAANKKVLLVTSPTAGDGKTSVIMNLTSTLLAEGKKILVIDTNFRRPSLGSNIPRPAQSESETPSIFGLSNYLMGQTTDPRYIVRPSTIEGLQVIDSGEQPPNTNPTEILGSPAMRKLLDTFRDSYDYILLDGPALLVSDAKVLAAMVEGTIVVFNAHQTHRGEAQRTLRELREIQATVVGTVLLGVENLKGGYFGQLYKAFQDYTKSSTKKDNPVVKPVN